MTPRSWKRETSVRKRSGGAKRWGAGAMRGRRRGRRNFKDERVRVTTLSGMLLSA